MNKILLAAGAAALAISGPALAGGQQGGGHGGGHGGGGQGKAKVERGGGGPKAAVQRQGGGNDRAQMKAERGNRGQGQVAKIDRGPPRADKVDRGGGKVDRGDRKVDVVDRAVVRVRDGGAPRVAVANYYGFDGGGCPPGLAKKGNGCLPPGQAKKLVGSALAPAYLGAMLDGPYRDWYRDDDRYFYRMGDGYIYRVDRGSNLISALFPYYDRDYSYYPVGMMYPSDFNYYNVPYQYRTYYPDGGDYLYRYGNGAIYSLDPQTQAVQSIVALLAGDLGVGQRLPATYGVYNVPLQYRAQYYDTPDNWYRYNDGYIYRVDPTTQLITAVINALV
ncbi:hypothetical protein H9L12_11985 [Sphingomonas rhizophila]|uniref:RcnB family protein n=1 Tax=Sphingomonas rhizophila TaxID=2071607 RepID=A0A7G9SAP5_9SPHN|nr:hypothetical protein [Sphingomonas rhizophila]QNN64920.1 hypothetical protein H9L12_11985 [Sphingomonas rhizophila]